MDEQIKEKARAVVWAIYELILDCQRSEEEYSTLDRENRMVELQRVIEELLTPHSH